MDARGSAGTTYAGYDRLNRQLWRNTTNSPSGAYITYSYDSTAGGNVGIGRLTGETFTGGPNHSLSGSYSSTYDVRGQTTHDTMTVGATSYPVASTYNDSGAAERHGGGGNNSVAAEAIRWREYNTHPKSRTRWTWGSSANSIPFRTSWITMVLTGRSGWSQADAEY